MKINFVDLVKQRLLDTNPQLCKQLAERQALDSYANEKANDLAEQVELRRQKIFAGLQDNEPSIMNSYQSRAKAIQWSLSVAREAILVEHFPLNQDAENADEVA